MSEDKTSKFIGWIFTIVGAMAAITGGVIFFVFILDDFSASIQEGYIIGALVPLIVGIVFLIIGVCFLKSIYAQKKKRKYLMAHGRKIYTEIDEIIHDYSQSINHRHPYRIICRWKDSASDITYFFKSGPIWFNPASIVEENPEQMVPVYYDPANIKKYYVSTEELSQKMMVL